MSNTSTESRIPPPLHIAVFVGGLLVVGLTVVMDVVPAAAPALLVPVLILIPTQLALMVTSVVRELRRDRSSTE